jgi:NADPH-dependent curcumin reductase CurA
LADKRSYLPPVAIGGVMRGTTISRVLASMSPKAKEGDIVSTLGGWSELAILPDAMISAQSNLPKVTNLLDYLGVCGTTGLTAYYGLEKIGQPKPGETVVVSGAAGATGSVVGQIAKLRGARVVGIAGSPDKCEWLKEVGFDEALNYKDPDFKQKFRDATKDFIDVYWDNGAFSTLCKRSWPKRSRSCHTRLTRFFFL